MKRRNNSKLDNNNGGNAKAGGDPRKGRGRSYCPIYTDRLKDI